MFANLRCKGNHRHEDNWGKSKQLQELQVWPWQLAERLIAGIQALLQDLKRQNTYPELGTGPGDPDQEDPPEPWLKCPGCKGRMARARREHTRVRGECKYPDFTPEADWQCPGCKRRPPTPRGHESHTEVPGQCRWATASSRTVAFSHHTRILLGMVLVLGKLYTVP